MDTIDLVLSRLKNFDANDNGIFIVEQLTSITDDKNESIADKIFYMVEVLVDRLRSILKSENNQEKVAIMRLLIIVLSSFPKQCSSKFLSIKETVFSVFRTCRGANEKREALLVLSEVLSSASGNKIAHELEIDDMINRLFKEFAQRPPATVFQVTVSTLGVIAKFYPEHFGDYAERLNDIVLKSLRSEMTSTSKAPQMSIIAGCVQSLYLLYTNFPPKNDAGETFISADLFKFVMKLMDPDLKLKRFEAVQQALEFFSLNGKYMQVHILSHCKDLLEYIRHWRTNANDPQLKARAHRASEVFFEQLSASLSSMNAKEAAKTFTHFAHKFRGMMTANSSYYDVTFAIDGYGAFAKLFREFLDQTEVRLLFDQIIGHIEKVFFSQTESTDKRYYKLPKIVRSLAEIIAQLSELSEIFVTPLVRLVEEMIRMFPHVFRNLTNECITSIFRVLEVLRDKPAFLGFFLEQAVLLGMIHTCDSQPASLALDTPGEVSYKQYSVFWSALLSDKDVSRSPNLIEMVYAEFIRCHVRMIGRLDLTLAGAQSAEEVSDPTMNLTATNPEDLKIFVNMVDCVTDVLKNCKPKRILPWFEQYLASLLKWLNEHTLLSGFYKLLANAVGLATAAGRFKNAADDDSTVVALTAVGRRTLSALKQHRDNDLRVACLQLVLSLPAAAVQHNLAELVPALQVAVDLSLSHLPMIGVLLRALDTWVEHMDEASADAFLTPVLPLFEPFLLSLERSAGEDAPERVALSRRRTRAQIVLRLKRQRIASAAVGAAAGPDLGQAQLAFLHFLGRLGSRFNHRFVLDLTAAVEADRVSFVKWDQETRLSYALPFHDLKPELPLDVFLPLVISLAKEASDRQTRVSATELLHSLLLFMAGRAAQLKGSRSSAGTSPMLRLWRNAFPAVLYLSCDLDEAIRSLMRPLTMQLIHWFSSTACLQSDEATTVLDAIFETLTCANHEAPQRDFAATALREFLSWAIRQDTRAKVSAERLDAVMERLCRLGLHPSADKRLGAAVAFNAVYRVFRENEELVNTFTFLLLDTFVNSMALAERESDGQGILQQTEQSIDHVERIVREKAALFSHPKEGRRCPRRWDRACTLDIAVRQMLRHCARPETRCRRRCMRLVTQLSDQLVGIGSVKNFFDNRLKTAGGASYFVQRFESEKMSLKGGNASTWLQNLCGVLDCYVWTISLHLLPVEILLTESTSKLLPSLCEFCAWLGRNEAKDPLTAWVTVGLMSLLVCFCNAHQSLSSNLTWRKFCTNPDVVRTLAVTFLQPRAVGFTLSDVEVMSKLPDECNQLLSWFKKASPDAVRLLKQSLSAELEKRFRKSLKESYAACCKGNNDRANDFLFLLQSLQKLRNTGWIDKDRFDFLTKNNAIELLDVLVQSLEEDTRRGLQPKLVTLRSHTFDFLLRWTGDISWLVDALCCPASGARVLAAFQQQLLPFLIETPPAISLLFKRSGTHSRTVASVLERLLESLKKDKELRDRCGANVTATFVASWKDLETWWKGEDSERKMAVVGFMTKLLLLNPATAKEQQIIQSYTWMLRDRSINPKTRVLDLLGYFLIDAAPNSALIEAVAELPCHLPARSSDVTLGSAHAFDYLEALSRLMTALEICGSSDLLRVLIGIICREEEHLCDEEFAATMLRLGENLSDTKLRALLDVAFSHVTNDSLNNTYRRLCVVKVLLPLLQGGSVAVGEAFLAQNARFLLGKAEARLLHLPSDPAPLEESLQLPVLLKTAALQLFGMAYLRLEKRQLHSADSAIVKAVCEGAELQEKAVTIRLTKACQAVLTEDYSKSAEEVRQMTCAAYNCLIAVVSVTQKDVKFYTAFLLPTREEHQRRLFENLVGCRLTSFVFPQELERPLRKKAQFEAVRRQRQSRTFADEDEEEEEEGGSSPVSYISSQYLSQSSLSTELSQYDRLAGTQILLSQTQGGDAESPRRSAVRSSSGPSSVVVESALVLEQDAVNSHPCMPALVRLFRHLRTLGILTDMAGRAASELHACMKMLHTKLDCSTSHPNVKIFIAKLIVNCQEIFKPYAGFFLSPLCQLLVSEHNGGAGIHTLFVDVMAMLLSWAPVAIPKDTFDDKALACRVVEYVMEHCHHDNTSLVRNNLSMLKLTLESWKSRITIDALVLSKHLKISPEPKNTRSRLGIQMLGAVIANGLPYYSPTSAIDRKRFLKLLWENIGHESKQVHASAAEVSGIILARMAAEADGELEEFQENVTRLILSHLNRKRLSVFVLCLAYASKHHTNLADALRAKLLFELPRMQDDSLALALDILARRPGEDLFLHLRGTICDVFDRKDGKVLHPALRLCSQVLGQEGISAEQREAIVTAIQPCSHHNLPEVRRAFYEVFIANFRDSDSRKPLLAALADTSQANRTLVHNFWSSDERLSGATCERSLCLFERLFVPEAEDSFLSYATSLLLEMTSRSPDYKKPILPDPLSPTASFDPYRPEGLGDGGRTRERGSSLTPLFLSATQAPEEAGRATGGGAQIRATMQQPAFAPTEAMDDGTGRNFNWLTQSSLAPDSMAISLSNPLPTQLLFESSPTTIQRALTRRRQPIGKAPAGPEAKEEPLSPRDLELLQLRQRFTKKAVVERFRTREMRKQKEHIKRKMEAPRGAVTLYRSYRIGDLPDVQIEHSGLVAPLQALALCDPRMAALLLTEVMRAIWKEGDRARTEEEQEEAGRRLTGAIEKLLGRSGLHPAPLVACCLNLALELQPQFEVAPRKVRAAAIASGNEALAEEVLEEKIRSGDEKRERPAKRQRTDLPSEPNVELARLYKSNGDIDNLIGLLETFELENCAGLAKALQFEAQRNFDAAISCYIPLIGMEWNDVTFMAQESLLACFNAVQSWDDVVDKAEKIVPLGLAMWDDVRLHECILPMSVRARTKRLLTDVVLDRDLESHEPLLEFLNESLEDKELKLLCENKFSEELALFSIVQEDFDRAENYCKLAFEQVLAEMCGSGELQRNRRRAATDRLQVFVEMEEYLKLASSFKNHATIPADQVRELFSRWTVRQPHPLHTPSCVWDDLVANRLLYHSKLCANVEEAEEDEEEEAEAFEVCRVRWRLSQVEAANQQRNFRLARAILQDLDPFMTAMRSSQDSESQSGAGMAAAWSDWNAIFAKTWHLDVGRLAEGGGAADRGVKKLLKLHPSIKHVRHRRPGEFHRLMAENAQLLAELWPHTGVDKRADVRGHLGCAKNDEVPALLSKSVIDCLTQSIAAFDKENSFEKTSEAQISLASFCDRHLRQHEESCEEENQLQQQLTERTYPELFVQSVLRAMAKDSIEARLRFARALQIAELYSDAQDAFVKECGSIPSWMLIMWQSQLLASLDKPESRIVQDSLLRIAADYPNALVYPFKVKQESLDFDDEEEAGRKAKAVADQLAEILVQLPYVDRFVAGLDQLTLPSSLVLDCLSDMDAHMMKTPTQRKSREILRKFKRMYENVFVDDSQATSSQTTLYEESVETNGEFRRRFAKKYGRVIEDKFGKDGKKLLAMKKEAFKHLQRELKDAFEKLDNPTKLDQYSMWLACFDGLEASEELEMPGQYEGWAKPEPERHVKVIRFLPEVLTLPSLRKPKRIKIIGSDRKEYPFLIKGGEDLRQDQRLEQAFGIVNRLFRRDPGAAQRQLRLRTYAVVPLTSRVGMLEWVENCKPFQEFITNTASKKQLQDIMQASNDLYKLTEIDPMRTYGKISRAEMLRQFANLSSKIPRDIMRRSFVAMTTGPEAFHALREAFQRSYGALCATHYLFGIGDRHTDNALICQRTGEVVGIDFGYSFGLHMQLPVVEVVPFRLTNQLQGLMEPVGMRGQYAQCLIAALDALRKRKDLMMTLMQVFVKDKSVDWARCAERARRENRAMVAALDTGEAWFPRQRIGLVRRKFEGQHPAEILCDEVTLFKAQQSWCKELCAALRGSKECPRAALPTDRSLTAQEQSTVLIDLATDPNLLGRSFNGWKPLV